MERLVEVGGDQNQSTQIKTQPTEKIIYTKGKYCIYYLKYKSSQKARQDTGLVAKLMWQFII
jgi:hypothetical protein